MIHGTTRYQIQYCVFITSPYQYSKKEALTIWKEILKCPMITKVFFREPSEFENSLLYCFCDFFNPSRSYSILFDDIRRRLKILKVNLET